MATAIWIGGATARAQVELITITTGTVDGGTFTVQMNSVTVATFTGGGSDDKDTVAAGLVADWLDDLGEGQYVTPADTTATTSGTFTATAKTAGRPFTTPTVSAGMSIANTNPSSGPNDWNIGRNWTANAAPSAGDDIQITGSSSILYNVNQSGTDFVSFKQLAGSTAGLGRADEAMRIDLSGTMTVELAGTGQAYLNIDATGTTNPVIYNTLAASTGQYGLVLEGAKFGVIRFMKGSMKFLGTATTIEQEYTSSRLSDTRLWIPEDAAVTNLHKTGGDCLNEEGMSLCKQDAGTMRIAGSASFSTVTCGGGTIIYDSSASTTTLHLDGGTVDFTGSKTGQTITTLNLGGGKVKLGEDTTLSTVNYNRRYEIAPLT